MDHTLYAGALGLRYDCYKMKSLMEIFYFINSKYWNKGYASEAVKCFLEYIENNNLVESLIGTVVKGNSASSKILLNNGFTKMEHSYKDEREFYKLQIQ